MRILYFSRDYNSHDHRFLTALAETEHLVGYLRLERQGHQLEDRPLPPAVQHIHWSGGKKPAKLVDGIRLLLDLKRVIHNFKPDLIQSGPVQRSAFLVALSGFHPLITMSWGYDLLIDAHRNGFWKWATRYTLNHSDALVADCETIRDLGMNFGMPPERIVTFPWGADIRKYTPTIAKWRTGIRERLGWDKEKFVLLSTRGWSDIYGVEDLARAFVRIVRQRPELRLLMLGSGPLAPVIHKIFRQGGVYDLVHIPGQISQDRLPEYYRSADIYISTSHSDGTSISLLEALASGTPVLLTDIPGNKEWVPNPDVVGWLYRDGDVESLIQGIVHAIDKKDKLPRMGIAARKLAESCADWESNFPVLFKAYEIALS